MRLVKVEEYGSCFECGKIQKEPDTLEFYEIELGTRMIHEIPLCEKCMRRLSKDIKLLLDVQQLKKEEAENES